MRAQVSATHTKVALIFPCRCWLSTTACSLWERGLVTLGVPGTRNEKRASTGDLRGQQKGQAGTGLCAHQVESVHSTHTCSLCFLGNLQANLCCSADCLSLEPTAYRVRLATGDISFTENGQSHDGAAEEAAGVTGALLLRIRNCSSEVREPGPRA